MGPKRGYVYRGLVKGDNTYLVILTCVLGSTYLCTQHLRRNVTCNI